ncbi:hypothetical protein HYT84_01385 [Candidatus Micrarchaeota archaeon]|nr:hypothetical protein [Candidatus Micrarchaeota archaeon]
MEAFKLEQEKKNENRLAFIPKKARQQPQQLYLSSESLERFAKNMQLPSEFAKSAPHGNKNLEVAVNKRRVEKQRGGDYSLVNAFSYAISSIS